MANLEIQEDIGGTLTFHTPRAPISAATCSLHDTDGTEIATPAVTLPLSTTVTATAAAGDTQLTIATTTAIAVGDRLFVSDDATTPQDGQGEWIRVKNIVSATVIDLYEPIAFPYANTDPVGGNALSVAVSAADAEDRGEGYEWRLSYRVTGDSADTKAVVQWDVVRTPWPDKLMTNWELKKHLGEMGGALMESVAYAGTDFEDDLEIATAIVKDSILERGYIPNRFRSLDEFKRPVVAMVALLWARRGENIPKMWRDVPETYLDAKEQEYRQAINTALNVNRSYDSDDSGVVSKAEKQAKLGFASMVR